MKARDKLSKGAASGMVALVFLVLGFQLAIFVVKVGERCPVEPDMNDDTGLRPDPPLRPAIPQGPPARSPLAPDGAFDPPATTKFGGYARPASSARPTVRTAAPKRTVETFAFDPNTVSLEDLVRLGLSPRQAESIENYRGKGGKFRSKADFQKMYVVSDSLFTRLEPFIEIPKLELNTADSAALVGLRGIGPWYARKILDYRERLGGFVAGEQLMEIDGIDAERFAGFSEEIVVDAACIRRLDIWHASDSVLARHPYLGVKGARSVVRYRALYDSAHWTPEHLAQERVLPEENIEKLKKYIANQ